MSERRNKKCHVCNQTKKNIVKCSAFRCSLSYCYDCIWSIYDKDFEPEKIVPSCWICYSCGKACQCNQCLGILPKRKKRVQLKQKLQKSIEQQQKSLENQQNNSIKQNFYFAQLKQPNFIKNQDDLQIKNQEQTKKTKQIQPLKICKTVIISQSNSTQNQVGQNNKIRLTNKQQNINQSQLAALFQIYYQPCPYIFYYY